MREIISLESLFHFRLKSGSLIDYTLCKHNNKCETTLVIVLMVNLTLNYGTTVMLLDKKGIQIHT